VFSRWVRGSRSLVSIKFSAQAGYAIPEKLRSSNQLECLWPSPSPLLLREKSPQTNDQVAIRIPWRATAGEVLRCGNRSNGAMRWVHGKLSIHLTTYYSFETGENPVRFRQLQQFLSCNWSRWQECSIVAHRRLDFLALGRGQSLFAHLASSPVAFDMISNQFRPGGSGKFFVRALRSCHLCFGPPMRFQHIDGKWFLPILHRFSWHAELETDSVARWACTGVFGGAQSESD
jgi:hypothetical protein